MLTFFTKVSDITSSGKKLLLNKVKLLTNKTANISNH